MQIGALGDIVFQVSSEAFETINNLVWSGSARYAKHDRHLTNSLTEFTGLEPDTISFDMVLSEYLGVDPLPELVKIWKYERSGKSLTFIVGDKTFGKYRWTIEKHKINMQTFSAGGKLTSATVSVSLLEYLRN
ncbi:MAG: hypothetical protein K0R50_388 [Eubacterium sp.]|jgi:hypothetical protein|nr:hypothetical protein [Eubacterium sp.]